jgi:hypothetical protein
MRILLAILATPQKTKKSTAILQYNELQLSLILEHGRELLENLRFGEFFLSVPTFTRDSDQILCVR